MEEKKYPVDTSRILEMEGMKDALTGFVYSELFTRIRKLKELDPDTSMDAFSEVYAVLDIADAIPTVYLSERFSPEEKEKLITEGFARATTKANHALAELEERIKKLSPPEPPAKPEA